MIHSVFRRGAQAPVAPFLLFLALALAACGDASSPTPSSHDADAREKANLKKLNAALRKAVVGVWRRDAEDFRDRLTTYTVDNSHEYLKMSQEEQNHLITRAHDLAAHQKAELEFWDDGRFEMRAYYLPPHKKNLSKKRGMWKFEDAKLKMTTTSINGKLVAPEPLRIYWDEGLLLAPHIEPFPWVFRRN